MSDYIPHDITTESGKELWRMFNQHYGSSVWGPVGDGIEKIEKEMRARVLAAVEVAMLGDWDDNDYDNWQCGDCGTWYDYTTKMCNKKLDDYLGVRKYNSIDDAIMSVVQKAIDAVPLTYLWVGYKEKPSGYWKNVNDIFIYTTNDEPKPYSIGAGSNSNYTLPESSGLQIKG